MANIESRRTDDGKTTYRVKVRLKGHPAQSASFSRLTDARRWEQSTEAAIREGRHFKTTEAKRHTVAAAITRYTKEVMPNKSGSASQNFQLAWWRDQIGAYTLADITPAVIGDLRNRLLSTPRTPRSRSTTNAPPLKTLSAGTVVRYISVFSHLFSIAQKEWGWVEDNPVRKIRKPREPRGRERYLTDDERERLLAACKASGSHHLYTAVILALSTGMRRGEILTLRWEQVDFQHRRITLHHTKNGEQRIVPLAGLAYELVLAQSKVRSIRNNLLFPGQSDGVPVEIKTAWYAVLQAAHIENFRFHDLRHSAASYLAMNGATMLEIAAVLGHKTLSMVKRYSHLSDAHSQRVVESMNAKIFPVLQTDAGKLHG